MKKSQPQASSNGNTDKQRATKIPSGEMPEWVGTLRLTHTKETGRILAAIYYKTMVTQKGSKGPESLSDLLKVKQPNANDESGRPESMLPGPSPPTQNSKLSRSQY